jgi:hypothetical protein
LQTLFQLFPSSAYLHDFEILPADQVPEPYHGLLVHEHHMTVTVEAYHGSLVNVKVLERQREGDVYARKILLALQSDGRFVQFGLVSIRLNYCSPEVSAEILAEQTPLGRILINHNVLRRIEPTAYLRVTPGPDMMTWFGIQESEVRNLESGVLTYGRTAVIHCDGLPAIDLLEILAPTA